MEKSRFLMITQTAAAELARQSAFSATPGVMHLDLLEDTCGEGWLYIRIRPGDHNGVPIARADGVTLYAPTNQLSILQGLRLNYFGDLTGGGFLISAPQGSEGSACGSGFKLRSGSFNSLEIEE